MSKTGERSTVIDVAPEDKGEALPTPNSTPSSMTKARIAMVVISVIIFLAIIGLLIWLIIDYSNWWCGPNPSRGPWNQTALLISNASQSLTGGGVIVFETIAYNTTPSCLFKVTSGPTGGTRIQALVAGIYEMSSNAVFTTSTGGSIGYWFNVNGGSTAATEWGYNLIDIPATTQVVGPSISSLMYLYVNDYVEVWSSIPGVSTATVAADARLSARYVSSQ
jgi:hypothetical protein